MPFYYDTTRAISTNGSANTESTHYRIATVANQETAKITGLFAASRFATAGGAQIRLKDNSGTAASGGTAQTPRPKNLRGSPAAQTTFFNDATAITAGTTLTTRLTVGSAQTGGMGGYVPIEPSAAVQMMPNTTNPVDCEITSLAASATVLIDLTIEHSEGV